METLNWDQKYYERVQSTKLATLRNMIADRATEGRIAAVACGFPSFVPLPEHVEQQVMALCQTIERDADMEGSIDYDDVQLYLAKSLRPVKHDDYHGYLFLTFALWSRLHVYPFVYGEAGRGNCAIITEACGWIIRPDVEYWIGPMYNIQSQQAMAFLRIPFKEEHAANIDLWLFEHGQAVLQKKPVF